MRVRVWFGDDDVGELEIPDGESVRFSDRYTEMGQPDLMQMRQGPDGGIEVALRRGVGGSSFHVESTSVAATRSGSGEANDEVCGV